VLPGLKGEGPAKPTPSLTLPRKPPASRGPIGLSSRATPAKLGGDPGPIATALSINPWLWVPAYAGTTADLSKSDGL